MQSPQQQFDAYTAAFLFASWAFGAEAAPLISAYGLILGGWVFGCLVGVFVRRQGLPIGAYLAMSFLASVLLTGFIAAKLGDAQSASGWLVPISATLAAFTDKATDWMGGLIARVAAVLGGKGDR
jgi:hypothetical protein